MTRIARAVVVAILICAPTANARVAIISTSHRSGAYTDQNACDRCDTYRTIPEVVIGIMDRIGQPYDIIHQGMAKTEWCRTGVFGTAGGGSQAYTAVFHLAPKMHINSNNNTFGYRPDSLSLAGATTTPLAVPQVFFAPDADFQISGGRDSLGFNSGAPLATAGGWSLYTDARPDIRWRTYSDEAEPLKSTNTPGGYLRVLVGARSNACARYYFNQVAGDDPSLQTNCVDCDSLIGDGQGFLGTQVDTGTVWAGRMNHPSPGSMPIVCCAAGHFWADGIDPTAVLIALAYVDSLTGGGIFDANKLPLKLGIQIRGGWRRNARTFAGGISPNDSTTFKSSIDSLASLRTPFVVGVNVDSLADYADDKIWWARAAPYVHYAPEQWGGVVGGQPLSIPTRGTTSWQRPLDPLGNARSRVLYGPSGTTSDTSMFMLVRANYFKLDSVFGSSQVDRIILGANFRNVPTSLAGKRDSVMACLADAGVRGVVVNSFWRGSGPSLLPSSLSFSLGGGISDVLYGRMAGSRFKEWATPGYVDSGSSIYMGGLGRSSIGGYKHIRKVDSFLRGAFAGRTSSPTVSFPGEGTLSPSDTLHHVLSSKFYRIFTIHASDLGSGTLADNSSRPSRQGWWQIKSIVNSSKAINIMAGRPVVVFDYPENIDR